MQRRTAVAGAFYPSESTQIKSLVQKFLDDAPSRNFKNLRGLIVPHAGYIYSGPTAGFGYKMLLNLPDRKYNVFLLGPSHFVYTTVSIGDFDEFETPLGNVKVNKTICKDLLQNIDIEFLPQAHGSEHSLEVQLPFLQLTLKDFEIIPFVLGEVNTDRLADILNPYFQREDSLFIFSSDLSHYNPYLEAKKIDANSIDKIIFLDIANEGEIDACGKMDIEVAVRLAKKNSYKITLLDYRNSGDTAGEKDSVVGYAALSLSK